MNIKSIAVTLVITVLFGILIGWQAARVANSKNQVLLQKQNSTIDNRNDSSKSSAAPETQKEKDISLPQAKTEVSRVSNSAQIKTESNNDDIPYLLDVTKILNKTPEEVESIVGKPDYGYSNTTWQYMPAKKAFYKNELLDAFFIDNELVRLSIDPKVPFGLNSKALGAVGLNTKKAPTISNTYRMTWMGINGYYEVTIFPEYIHIITDGRYK